MAKKTKKSMEKNIQAYFEWKWGCMYRKPDYEKDWKKLLELDIKLHSLMHLNDDEISSPSELEECRNVIAEMNEINKKYGVTYLPDPNDRNGGGYLRYGCSSGVSLQQPKSPLESSSGEYRVFKVNIWGKKEMLLHEVCRLIEQERKRELKNGAEIQRFNKSPHLRNSDRYFKVFDLRNNRPPTPYRNIAANLMKKGYYKGKSVDKAENLARKDYLLAFEEVYGRPYKKNKDLRPKDSNYKTCGNCSKYSQCKEPCAELDYELTLVTVGQKEKILSNEVEAIA